MNLIARTTQPPHGNGHAGQVQDSGATSSAEALPASTRSWAVVKWIDSLDLVAVDGDPGQLALAASALRHEAHLGR